MMAYFDDIVIATETFEDHMARLRVVFARNWCLRECLREAGFKMRVAKCNFLKSRIKYLERVASAHGNRPDPKAMSKLRNWEVPRNKTEKFLGFAKYYREFIPWQNKLLPPDILLPAWVRFLLWGMSSNRLSTPLSYLCSRRLLRCNRIQREILYWTLIPVLLQFLVFCISGKILRKKAPGINCVREKIVECHSSITWRSQA